MKTIGDRICDEIDDPIRRYGNGKLLVSDLEREIAKELKRLPEEQESD